MRIACRATTFALISHLVATPMLQSQPAARVLRLGEVVSEQLSSSDPRTLAGASIRSYGLLADSGKMYRIQLTSRAAPAALRLLWSVAGVSELIGDGDTGRGGDALIRFRAPRTGTYTIAVGAEADVTAGVPFELIARELPPHPAVPRMVRLGDSTIARFSDTSALSDQDGMPYDIYTFHVQRGQRVQVYVGTDSLKGSAVLALGQWRAGAFVELPDTADPTAPRLDAPTRALRGLPSRQSAGLVASTDGEYAVRVSAEDSGEQGSYVLVTNVVSATDQVNLAAPRVLTAGRESAGLLDPRRVGDDRVYDEWSYEARADELITFDLKSTEFDTYLQVQPCQGDWLSNDDIPGGTDSRITLRAPVACHLLLRIKSGGRSGGRYALLATTHASVGHQLRTTKIASGERVDGRLAEGDAVMDDGSSYQDWIYTAARAGERITVTMTSKQFDTFLMIGRMERGVFVEYARNDDAAGDTPEERLARVVLVAPAKGQYVIRANTFGPGQGGAYKLIVESR